MWSHWGTPTYIADVFTPPSLKSFELEWLAGLGSRDVQGILRTAWGQVSEGDTKGGSWDVQGILRTVWTPVGNIGHPSILLSMLNTIIILIEG